jgi:hypothetical protein
VKAASKDALIVAVAERLINIFMVKLLRAQGGCLGVRRR